ncbi:unnamed protein product [Ascophyllum nodosum]
MSQRIIHRAVTKALPSTTFALECLFIRYSGTQRVGIGANMSKAFDLQGPTADEKFDDYGEGDNDAWGLLERARRWFYSGEFQRQIDTFARRHAHEFGNAVATENKTGEFTHSFRHCELHSQYLDLVETLFSDFLVKEDRTAEELFSDLKDAHENNYTPLFEEHQYHEFAQAVLAATEYEEFYRIMLAKATSYGVDCNQGKCRTVSRERRDYATDCDGDASKDPSGDQPYIASAGARRGDETEENNLDSPVYRK